MVRNPGQALERGTANWPILDHPGYGADLDLGIDDAAILGTRGLRVIEGSLTLGSLVAFQSLMASFSEPVATLVNYVGSFQTIKGALDRLEDVYNYPLNDATKTGAQERTFPAKLAGSIEFRDVQFGYSVLEPPLISGLSITVNQGRAWLSSAPPAAENPP